MKISMHTGCSCLECRKGRSKKLRKYEYHKRLRKIQKQELKRDGNITTENISIGYTD